MNFVCHLPFFFYFNGLCPLSFVIVFILLEKCLPPSVGGTRSDGVALHGPVLPFHGSCKSNACAINALGIAGLMW